MSFYNLEPGETVGQIKKSTNKWWRKVTKSKGSFNKKRYIEDMKKLSQSCS